MALAEGEIKQFVVHMLRRYDIRLVDRSGQPVDKDFDWFREDRLQRLGGIAQMRETPYMLMTPRAA
jgi:hypothetical protein